MKKRGFLLAFVFSLAVVQTAFAGEFVSDEKGQWYKNEDGTWPVGWFQDPEGNWYNADSDGYIRYKWYGEKGKRYYLREGSGRMIADRTITLDRKVYRFDENGVSSQLPNNYTGWMLDDVTWYYRLSDGTFVTSAWKQADDKWYYFDENSYMVTGPLLLDGVQYYLDETTGAMAADETRTIDGVLYSFDATGAGTVVWPYKMPLAVPPEDQKSEFHKSVDAMADQVLAGIINDSMSSWQKATAIYNWVKGHLRYSGYSPVGDWVGGAYDGLRRRRGDCYTYYATSAELLNRAGFQTIEVIRSTDNNHYWNLVNVDGSWFHFDPCPRRLGGEFCLLTDSQIAWSSSHVFDHSLYPPTP